MSFLNLFFNSADIAWNDPKSLKQTIDDLSNKFLVAIKSQLRNRTIWSNFWSGLRFIPILSIKVSNSPMTNFPIAQQLQYNNKVTIGTIVTIVIDHSKGESDSGDSGDSDDSSNESDGSDE